MSTSLADLRSFRVARVLAEDPVSKRIALLGSLEGKDGDAVLLMEAISIDPNIIPKMLDSVDRLDELLSNDVYQLNRAYFSSEFVPLKVSLVFPAPAKDVAKAEAETFMRVEESPDIYQRVSLKYIQEIPSSRIQWVYNILDKKCESERIIVEDDSEPVTGFLLVPDFKWDAKNNSSLYCLAICHRRDIRSLRDLTADHLPLLRNILHQSYEALETTFGICKKRLRAFVHYHPTFYHFHVHFAVSSVYSQGVAVGKAHCLEDIIDNLVLNSDYYRQRTLTCFLPENHDLYLRIQTAGQS